MGSSKSKSKNISCSILQGIPLTVIKIVTHHIGKVNNYIVIKKPITNKKLIAIQNFEMKLKCFNDNTELKFVIYGSNDKSEKHTFLCKSDTLGNIYYKNEQLSIFDFDDNDEEFRIIAYYSDNNIATLYNVDVSCYAIYE